MLKASKILGKGEEHSKFSPGFIFYRNAMEISADKNLGAEIKNVCKGNEIKERDDKIIVVDDRKKGVSDICEGIAKRHGKKIEISPNGKLVITVESFGQISPEHIFKSSIKELKKDLNEISKKV